MSARPAILLVVLALLGGIATSLLPDGDDRAASGQAPARDERLVVAGVVPPRPAGVPPRSLEVLRARQPGGGELAVTLKRVRREGRRVPPAWRDLYCLDAFDAADLATRRFHASAGCRPRAGLPDDGRLGHSASWRPGGPTRISGFAPAGTRRLTVSGLGVPAAVPLGRAGAWLILVADGVQATLTITAELSDGTTRFSRMRIPVSSVPVDAPQADDPLDDSTWSVRASVRRDGHRAGQTCAQFFQQAANGLDVGFGPPMCGDLRRELLFADALQRGPGPRTKFGGGPRVPRRLIVWGAASDRIRALALQAPAGINAITIDPDGRGFIAVLSPEIMPGEVTLRATLADGSVRTWTAPDRVGVAPLTRVPLRRTAPLRATLDATRRQITLKLGVTGNPDTVKAVVLHRRPVYLHRVAGRPNLYRGTVPLRRPRSRGERLDAYTVICAPGCVDRREDVTLR